MSDSVRIVLALVLVVAALFGEKIVDVVKNNVEIVNEPTVQVVEPSLQYKELVKPIVDIDISGEDADLISSFYVELADVVKKDDGVIDSTGQFRNFNIMAGVLHFNTSIQGKYETLGESVDEAIVNTIGKQSVELDDDKRQDLADVLEAVAWGVTQ